MLFGVDLGYRRVKAVASSGARRAFSSAVALAPDLELDGTAARAALGGAGGERMTVAVDGRAYYVGESAHGVRGAAFPAEGRKLQDTLEVVRLMAALGAVSNGRVRRARIVTGLPVREHDAQHEALAELIRRDWAFGFCGSERRVEVEAVEVVPQGAGVYFDYLLSDRGRLARRDAYAETIMVVDVGGRTTDIVTMREGDYLRDQTDGVEIGVRNIQEHVGRYLARELGETYGPAALEGAVRQGWIRHYGERYDLQDAIAEIVPEAWAPIFTRLAELVETWGAIDRMLLAGGGALLIAPHLEAMLQRMRIEVVPEPEFGNARGYLKYGLLVGRANGAE